MKKILAMLLAVLAILSMVACAGEEEAPVTPDVTPTDVVEEVPQGKVLNIWCWNVEFQDRFNRYFEVPDGVEVVWTITPSDNLAYQDKLDAALLNQDSLDADEKIDIFLIEADYALKYVDTDYTASIYGDVGLTEADTANMYQYTKDICTDSNGVLKGVSWQGCPGALIYRRSIAAEVLGSDDPETVQAAVDSWEKFDAVAAQMKAAGYTMLGSLDIAYRVYSNNVSAPWVDANGKIAVDDAIKAWIVQTKNYADNGYNMPNGLWDNASMGSTTTFCTFGPAWFFDFCLEPAQINADLPKEVGNGTYGDWAICKGPQGFFWGGTWICASASSDNFELIKEVMLKLTCDKSTLVAITDKYGDFTNNQPAMELIAADATYGKAFLGGQNHIAVLAQGAAGIDMSNATGYDQAMNEGFQAAFKDYFTGLISEEEAYENFYTAILTKYPELSR